MPRHTMRPTRSLSPWHASVQVRIGTGLLVVLLMLAAGVLGAFFWFGRDPIVQQNLRWVDQTGATIVAELTGRIGRGEVLCQATAWVSEQAVLGDPRFPATLREILQGEGRESLVAGGGFWPEPRAFDPARERASLFWGRQENGQLKAYEDYNAPSAPDYHREEWYVPVRYMAPGRAYWSKSYVDPYSLQPMVTCSVAVMRQGSFAGVQTVDLRLEGLEAFMAQASSPLQGYAFILDRTGTFVSFPDHALVRQTRPGAAGQPENRFMDIEQFAAREPAYASVVRALRDLRERTLRAGTHVRTAQRIAAEASNISFGEAQLLAAQLADTETHPSLNGLRVVLDRDPVLKGPGVASIFHMPATHWDVVVVTPRSLAMKEAHRITGFLAFSLLGAVMLPLTAAFFLVRILVVRPLQSMSRALQVIAPEGTGAPVELAEAMRGDELGQLARSYNDRSAQLATTLATLAVQERDYRSLFENLQDVYYRSDDQGRVILVSPSVRVLLGYSQEEAIGMDLATHVYAHPEDRSVLLRRLQTEGFVRDFETLVRRKDRGTLWVSINSQVWRNAAGCPVGVEGTVRDITLRKQAELEIEGIRAFLKQILDAMPSILIAVDREGRVREWNRPAEEATGLTSREAWGRLFWEVAPFLSCYLNDFPEVITQGKPRRYLRQALPGPGTHFYDTTLYPLDSLAEAGLVIRMDDTTELEQKDQQLRQVQKMETLGVLAGGLAHDFNNVLSAVSGALSLLRYAMEEGEVSREELETDLGVIEEAARRASDIVQQLLTLSRQQGLQLVPTDLNQASAQVVKLCRNSLDKTIQLNFQPAPEPAVILGDPGQVEQVLLNLAVNGGHAMTLMRQPGDVQGGTLTMAIYPLHADPFFCLDHPEAREGDYWLISVRDTGIGMDTKTAAKAFDPFFTTKGKGQGTGLGLAMVYSIVKAHQGFIDVYSEPGVGTTFTVYFPAHEGTGALQAHHRKPKPMLRGEGCILVVDDEASLRKVSRSMLQTCGFTVVEAQDGEEAVTCFQSEPDRFRAVLLDIAMPRQDGLTVCGKLLQLRPDLPILMTSGFRQDPRIDAALTLGARAFLPKPYTLDQLSEALGSALRGGLEG